MGEFFVSKDRMGKGKWILVFGVLLLAICGSAVAAKGSNAAVFIAEGDTTLSSAIYFSQYGAGNGISSQIVLFNNSNTTAVGSIDLYDQDGNPLAGGVAPALDGASSIPFELGGFASLIVPSVAEGDLAVGSVIVSSDRPIGGNMVFTIGTLITGVAPSKAMQIGLIPVDTDPLTVRTATALQNPGDEAVTLRVTLLDLDGYAVQQTDETTDIVLPAKGQVAKFVDEIFDLQAIPTKGLLRVEVVGDGEFAGVGMQWGTTQFTTIPYTEAAE